MDKICGNCHYYANSPLHGPWCTKNRKEVSYLQSAFDCWTEPGTAPAEEMQMKVCSRCGRELPITNFGRHFRTKDGYQPCCCECQSEMNKGHKKRGPFEHNEKPAKPEEPEKIPEGMKKCSHCGKILPVSEFRKHKGSPDGLQYACKTCQVEMTTKAKQKRTAKKKALLEEVQKEAMMKKVLAEMPAASSEPEVIIPSNEPQKLDASPEVNTPIINELLEPQKPVPTLASATDDQLVEELKRRGYTGNVIKKISFIL